MWCFTFISNLSKDKLVLFGTHVGEEDKTQDE